MNTILNINNRTIMKFKNININKNEIIFNIIQLLFGSLVVFIMMYLVVPNVIIFSVSIADMIFKLCLNTEIGNESINYMFTSFQLSCCSLAILLAVLFSNYAYFLRYNYYIKHKSLFNNQNFIYLFRILNNLHHVFYKNKQLEQQFKVSCSNIETINKFIKIAKNKNDIQTTHRLLELKSLINSFNEFTLDKIKYNHEYKDLTKFMKNNNENFKIKLDKIAQENNLIYKDNN